MIRFAPICLAESIPSNPTAPSPTTATVEPGFTFAASAANQPVPMTSESVNKLGMLAGRLVSDMAVGTGIVGREERTDDELAGFNRFDRAPYFLHDAAILVPHWGGLSSRLNATIPPQIRPAHARGRDSDDGVRRLDDFQI